MSRLYVLDCQRRARLNKFSIKPIGIIGTLVFALVFAGMTATVARAAVFDSNADPSIWPMLDGFSSLPPSTISENDAKATAINNGATPAEHNESYTFDQYPYTASSLMSLDYAGTDIKNAYNAANSAGEVSLANTLLAQATVGDANNAYLKQEWGSADTAKEHYNYLRPYCRLSGINTIPGYDSGTCPSLSYPSGHSMIAWNEGVGLAIMLPELAPQIMARTAYVANGRVVAGVHYPLDVIAGRAIATRMIAYRMHDDTWKAKFDAARTQLRSAIEAHCGKTIAECIASSPPTMSNTDARAYARDKLTYGFTRVGAAGQTFQAPDYSYELLDYAYPTATQAEKEQILVSTAIDSGYPLDTTGTAATTANIGWTRLDLGAALNQPTTPPATGTSTFDYSTTPSTEVDAIRKAVMNVTAGTCNNFVSGTTASPTGVTVPETGVTMLGGFDFSINCTAAGGQATIDITLGKLYPDTSKLRFYKKTATSAPTDVTSQFTVRNTATATVATYTIVDGVNFDSDATVNGVLDDPLYVGVLGATDSTTPVDTAAGSGRGALADTGQAIVPFLLASVVLFGSAKAVHNWKAKRYKLHA